MLGPNSIKSGTRWLGGRGSAPDGRIPTANLRTKILDFRGFDSSTILNLRGGILRPVGNFPGILSQGILLGMIDLSREIGRTRDRRVPGLLLACHFHLAFVDTTWATQRDPHPRRSDSIHIISLDCSEQAQLCAYLESCYIQQIFFCRGKGGRSKRAFPLGARHEWHQGYGYGQSLYEDSGFHRAWLKQNLKIEGWNSHVHRDFPGNFKSTNLSREIGRMYFRVGPGPFLPSISRFQLCTASRMRVFHICAQCTQHASKPGVWPQRKLGVQAWQVLTPLLARCVCVYENKNSHKPRTTRTTLPVSKRVWKTALTSSKSICYPFSLFRLLCGSQSLPIFVIIDHHLSPLLSLSAPRRRPAAATPAFTHIDIIYIWILTLIHTCSILYMYNISYIYIYIYVYWRNRQQPLRLKTIPVS